MITMIENTLKYYYNFENVKLKQKNDGFIVEFNDNTYYFYPTFIFDDELTEILDLCNHIQSYDKNISVIILNKFGEITVLFNNHKYILVKIGKSKNVSKFLIYLDRKKYGKLYRTNWGELWSSKIDYLEFQREHVKGIYNELDKYFDFFVGLTENAISLANNTINLYKDLKVSIQHKRYDNFFYDNPTNIVIDYSVRDVSEFVKYQYFFSDFDFDRINDMLLNFKFNSGEKKLLFSRLLFPSVYFDFYDKIINDANYVNIENNVLEKINNYCVFLKKVAKFQIFNEIVEDFKWIK